MMLVRNGRTTMTTSTRASRGRTVASTYARGYPSRSAISVTTAAVRNVRPMTVRYTLVRTIWRYDSSVYPFL